MGLAQMTAAPSEFTVDGKTYYLSPLADEDFGQFERWVQDRYLDVAKRNLGGLGKEDREALLKNAYEKAAELTISSPEALNLMTTTDGSAKLLHLSLLRRHPDITFQEVTQLVTNPTVVRISMDRIKDLNAPGYRVRANQGAKVKKKSMR